MFPPMASFLEMLDAVNEELINKGEDPIGLWTIDCREGYRGAVFYDQREPTVRKNQPRLPTSYAGLIKTAIVLTLEPVVRPPLPDDQRSDDGPTAFDRIITAGGYISPTPEAPVMPYILIRRADHSFNAAACIGRGLRGFCKNRSISSLPPKSLTGTASARPSGKKKTGERMVAKDGQRRFWRLHQHRSCSASCRKTSVSVNIARMTRIL